MTDSGPSHTGTSRGQPRATRSFSQNPQEPEVPLILAFKATPSQTSYAKAASRTHSGTASTQISTITADQVRGLENEVQSLRKAYTNINQLCSNMNEKIDKLQPPPDSHQQANESHQQDHYAQPHVESGTQQMFQELLKRIDRQTSNMDNHAATNQARFDTLEGQQTGTAFDLVGMKANFDHLRQDNTKLRETNSLIMERMDLLEGAKRSTFDSPIRKFCRNGDGSTPASNKSEDGGVEDQAEPYTAEIEFSPAFAQDDGTVLFPANDVADPPATTRADANMQDSQQEEATAETEAGENPACRS